MSTPYYLREYRTLMRNLRKRYADGNEAFERAVGGNFEKQGEIQAELVLKLAPDGAFNMLDIGCGSGRAAAALRGEERLTYIGVDILPELLDYAREKTARPDWRFEAISDIALPVENDWADLVLIMSVFTHLKAADIKRYIAECKRVLKPGGLVACSYLDRGFRPHVEFFKPKPLQWVGKKLGWDVTLAFTSREELSGWFEEAGFIVDDVITYETSRQHVMVARKPEETAAS